jgi:hypothetical protein
VSFPKFATRWQSPSNGKGDYPLDAGVFLSMLPLGSHVETRACRERPRRSVSHAGLAATRVSRHPRCLTPQRPRAGEYLYHRCPSISARRQRWWTRQSRRLQAGCWPRRPDRRGGQACSAILCTQDRSVIVERMVDETLVCMRRDNQHGHRDIGRFPLGTSRIRARFYEHAIARAGCWKRISSKKSPARRLVKQGLVPTQGRLAFSKIHIM